MLYNHPLPPSDSVGHPFAARRWLLGLAAVVLLRAPAGAQTIQESTSPFPMQGKNIAMQCFTPAKEGRYPAILLLHGSAGMKDALIYRHIARLLAEHSYVALIVPYFERTGTKRIEPKDITETLFVAWMETVQQAVRQASKLPQVDGQRIGLLGFSLGAYVSLAVATQDDLPIAAVADLFGGMPEKLRKKVKSLPPTLIIHGDADRTVPVQEALTLEKLLRQHQRTYETKIYCGQDHLFQANRFGADVRDARDRTLAFFDKHLKAPSAVRDR